MDAAAIPPPPPLVARALAVGSVTLRTRTRPAQHVLWLYRPIGRQPAFGQATVDCVTAFDSGGAGSEHLFTFRIDGGGRRKIWKNTGTRCRITVQLTGAGLLTIELRGS